MSLCVVTAVVVFGATSGCAARSSEGAMVSPVDAASEAAPLEAEGRHADDGSEQLSIRLDGLVVQRERMVEPAAVEVSRCEDLCSLATSICGVKEKLCNIAEERPSQEELQGMCRKARLECREARESCVRCVESHRDLSMPRSGPPADPSPPTEAPEAGSSPAPEATAAER